MWCLNNAKTIWSQRYDVKTHTIAIQKTEKFDALITEVEHRTWLQAPGIYGLPALTLIK